MTLTSVLTLIAAAVFEVGGVAMIRKGIVTGNSLLIVPGFIALGTYGIVVNLIRWEFARLLGSYVSVFAVTALVYSIVVFKERLPPTTWVGIALIALGGLILQAFQR